MTEHQPDADPAAAQPAPPDGPAAANSLLDTVADLPLDQHPDVYEQVHAGLRSALTDINDA